MRRAWIAAAAALLVAAHGHAQWSIEADLNGVLGDPQPDHIVTAVGQTIPVDVWFLGPPNWYCCFFETFLCEPAHGLGYENTQFYLDACWGHSVNGPDSSGCIRASGGDFCLCDLAFSFPYRVATVTYVAAVDRTIAEVVLGPGSRVWNASFSTEYFDNNGSVIARIQIGDVTATETTSWGSIKTLFR